MQFVSAVAFSSIVLLSGVGTPREIARRALPTVLTNPNLERAGVLRDGVLTIELEAKESAWQLNGPNRAPMTVAAFSQSGKPPLIPGPLVRAPQGTELRLSVRNSLPRPLTVVIPAAIRGGRNEGSVVDSVVIEPGAIGHLTTHGTVPGNYVYRAKSGQPRLRVIDGLLAGAIVIDTAGAITPPHDRVLVIMASMDSVLTANATAHGDAVNFNAPP